MVYFKSRVINFTALLWKSFVKQTTPCSCEIYSIMLEYFRITKEFFRRKNTCLKDSSYSWSYLRSWSPYWWSCIFSGGNCRRSRTSRKPWWRRTSRLSRFSSSTRNAWRSKTYSCRPRFRHSFPSCRKIWRPVIILKGRKNDWIYLCLMWLCWNMWLRCYAHRKYKIRCYQQIDFFHYHFPLFKKNSISPFILELSL